jgi:hypothetical protein
MHRPTEALASHTVTDNNNFYKRQRSRIAAVLDYPEVPPPPLPPSSSLPPSLTIQSLFPPGKTVYFNYNSGSDYDTVPLVSLEEEEDIYQYLRKRPLPPPSSPSFLLPPF